MIISTKAKKLIGVVAIFVTALLLGIFGTYFANDCSWDSVIRLLTLPQCVIGYIIAVVALICLALHWALRQDTYYN